jgi:hypothetical protein
VPGPGRSRTIPAKKGTLVLVRFAMVRGEVVSAWGTPVSVTIP